MFKVEIPLTRQFFAHVVRMYGDDGLAGALYFDHGFTVRDEIADDDPCAGGGVTGAVLHGDPQLTRPAQVDRLFDSVGNAGYSTTTPPRRISHGAISAKIRLQQVD
ncbi:hypothetical protein [Streptomyces niveus]|uniref:hypothetical protein n=1 Tax=Streptomyces niveus TaxID=193462 RepID=UPI00386B82E7